MKNVSVVNNTSHPEMLESGVILPAAGTLLSGPRQVSLSALDHARLVVTGKVSVLPAPEAETADAETKTTTKRAAARDEK